MKVRLGMRLHMLEHFMHVVARREVITRTSQDHEADWLRRARNAVHVMSELFEHVSRQRVEFLGAIQRQRCDPAAVLTSDQVAHNEAPSDDSTTHPRALEIGRRYLNIDSLPLARRPVRFADRRARRSAPRSAGLFPT